MEWRALTNRKVLRDAAVIGAMVAIIFTANQVLERADIIQDGALTALFWTPES